MHTNNETGSTSSKVKAKDARLSRLERELEATDSKKKHHEEGLFGEAYALIEQSLARNVPQKMIIEKFNAVYGLKLHPARFRQMLGEERSRRNQTGDLAKCKTCGHVLTPAGSPQPSTHATNDQINDQEDAA